ncbi:hypothetical protein QAD02_002860 [Eretmocerus hayati]|uniref:Uncharacterized protein n=1 Tax=Eretmocerus hayati TaxID=131215 RepID=A0ACC2NKH7_9HYME|nr:hypothetical protein QAD02_002860 [Eretmocerus hayati]
MNCSDPALDVPSGKVIQDQSVDISVAAVPHIIIESQEPSPSWAHLFDTEAKLSAPETELYNARSVSTVQEKDESGIGLINLECVESDIQECEDRMNLVGDSQQLIEDQSTHQYNETTSIERVTMCAHTRVAISGDQQEEASGYGTPIRKVDNTQLDWNHQEQILSIDQVNSENASYVNEAETGDTHLFLINCNEAHRKTLRSDIYV